MNKIKVFISCITFAAFLAIACGCSGSSEKNPVVVGKTYVGDIKGVTTTLKFENTTGNSGVLSVSFNGLSEQGTYDLSTYSDEDDVFVTFGPFIGAIFNPKKNKLYGSIEEENSDMNGYQFTPK
jgi:hypothetical protein